IYEQTTLTRERPRHSFEYNRYLCCVVCISRRRFDANLRVALMLPLAPAERFAPEEANVYRSQANPENGDPAERNLHNDSHQQHFAPPELRKSLCDLPTINISSLRDCCLLVRISEHSAAL